MWFQPTDIGRRVRILLEPWALAKIHRARGGALGFGLRPTTLDGSVGADDQEGGASRPRKLDAAAENRN